MEGNEMSISYENTTYNRHTGLAGGRMGCTLVTGFLGSGKTTLLKHLINSRHDLRLAVLVNEFADSDVDSLILDSNRLNSAFNLNTVSLTHGCGCCDVKGPFREALQRIVDSKHNFDCLLIETSGLARPDKFVADLEQVGIHLDITVAVVDAESLDKILNIDVVKQQLQHVDLVLLNKCDLATLGQVSDAEDILERLTGGAKVVRSQFCKVPLDLVIDCSRIEAMNTINEEYTAPGVLSHESMPKMTFNRNRFGRTSIAVSSISSDRSTPDNLHSGLSHGGSFSSVTFESELPISLSLFQKRVLNQIRSTKGLLRAKGIIWFAEDRTNGAPSEPESNHHVIGTVAGGSVAFSITLGMIFTGSPKELKESRFIFQWSGIKRVEAISGRPWDSSPKSCLVFIGTNKSELDGIILDLSEAVDPHPNMLASGSICKEYARNLSMKIAADGRFKEPSLRKEPIVIFGLRGSSLRGIKESELSGALMRLVNGRGNIFVSAITFGEDYDLQLLPDESSDLDEVWDQIRMAASAVISKICKNFCPCRSDLAAHVH